MHIFEFAADVVWICFKLNQQQSFLQHSHDTHFPSLKFEQFLLFRRNKRKTLSFYRQVVQVHRKSLQPDLK